MVEGGRRLNRFIDLLAPPARFGICWVGVIANGDARFGGETFHCQRVLMATGAVAPYIPGDIEGIEHADDPEAAVGEAIRMARLAAARQARKSKRARLGVHDQKPDQTPDIDQTTNIKDEPKGLKS